MIQVRELSKFYGKKAVVEKVNVNIHRWKDYIFHRTEWCGEINASFNGKPSCWMQIRVKCLLIKTM